MKKFKTENVSITMIVLDDGTNKQICVQYWEKKKQIIQKEIKVPTELCKQNFTDASLTKHLLNFFIKE